MRNNDKRHRFSSLSNCSRKVLLRIAAVTGAAIFIALAGINAQAAPIQFDITYSGTGWTPASENALQFAANTWGDLLISSYAGETINISAVFDGTMPHAVLGNGFPTAGVFNPSIPWIYPDFFYYPVAAANHLLGADQNPGEAEIEIKFNPDHNWYYGTDGNTPVGSFDFVTTSLHEIAHGLGIVSGTTDTGGLIFTTPDKGFATGYIYDTFVKDLVSNQYPISATNDPDRLKELTSGDVVFVGASATAANGGVPPQLYAPATFLQGSSIVHLDPTAFPNDLMKPSMTGAYSNHDPSAVDIGILKGIGWNFITPIPEPGSLLLFGTGAGVIVLAGYRRRRK